MYGFRGMSGNQPGCTLAEGGVFKPQCWCLDHPVLCSPDQYKAAVTWAYPGDVIVPLSPPPVPGAPTGAALTVPPATGEQAQTTVDDLLAAQMQAWQAQNAGTIAQTAANFNAIDTSGTGLPSLLPSNINWWLVGGVVAGVLVIGSIAAGGGSPRRYGR